KVDLGKVQAHRIAGPRRQTWDGVGEVAVAYRIVHDLRRRVGDVAGVDRIGNTEGIAARKIGIGNEGTGRGAAGVDGDPLTGLVGGGGAGHVGISRVADRVQTADPEVVRG